MAIDPPIFSSIMLCGKTTKKAEKTSKTLLCEQRFLSCVAFSVYEVVRLVCLSRSWQATTDKPRERFR